MEFGSPELQKLGKTSSNSAVFGSKIWTWSGSILASVGYRATILNCRFDAARCQHLRIWEATIEKTTFIED